MTKTNTEAVEALEPCPFCGGEASLLRAINCRTGENSGDLWYVICQPCDLVRHQAFEVPLADAIDAWNTRALSPTAKTEPSAAGLERELKDVVINLVNAFKAHCENVEEYLDPEDQADFDHWETEAFRLIAALSPTAMTEPSAAGLEDMRHLLDRDRYIVAIALGHIKRALNGHRWLLEGRGPYEWDDDRYRDEFADWVANVEAATGLLAKLAWDKDACETEADKVAAAREAARVYAVDPPVGHRTMLPSDLGLPCPSCAALSAPTRERELLVFLASELRAQEDCNTGRYDEWLARIDNLLNEGSGPE